MIKGKAHPRRDHEGPEREQRYGSILSLMLVLDGGRWSKSRPRQFTHEKETSYPMYRRLGGHLGQSGWALNISLPLEFDSQTIQHIASFYTNYTVKTHYMFLVLIDCFVFLNVSSLNRLQLNCHFWSIELSLKRNHMCTVVSLSLISCDAILYMCSTGSSAYSSFFHLRGSCFFTRASVCWTATVCNM
jgi:hypothetical protein